MSKVFVSSTLFWGTPLPETLRLVRQNGLAGLELWASSSSWKFSRKLNISVMWRNMVWKAPSTPAAGI